MNKKVQNMAKLTLGPDLIFVPYVPQKKNERMENLVKSTESERKVADVLVEQRSFDFFNFMCFEIKRDP